MNKNENTNSVSALACLYSAVDSLRLTYQESDPRIFDWLAEGSLAEIAKIENEIRSLTAKLQQADINLELKFND